MEIPFEAEPIQLREPAPFRLTDEEKIIVSREILSLLDKGVVEESEDCLGQVISNVFLRPKKNGEFRMILDLTWLNHFVEYAHFKMQSLQSALNLMVQDCWMGSIDLRDAYYSVPISHMHRKFLKFRWGGQLFQFTALPNGLACAPRIFTKILSPVFAHLREDGLVGFPYIDDSFVTAGSPEKCMQALVRLKELLATLGFVIHEEKSVLEPTRHLVFLGFNLDSSKMEVSLTQDKEDKFVRAARDVLNKNTPTIREVAGLVGLMIAYGHAFDYSGAHVKALEVDKNEALARARGDFDAGMRISQAGEEDILWWLDNIRVSGKHLEVRDPDMYTDASLEGWGAHCDGVATGGRWSVSEKVSHINVLELKAISLGLKSLCRMPGRHVKVMTDNTTALAYINHLGGVKSPPCNEVAREIWHWCEDQDVWLSCAHVPGVENVLADYRSRHFADNTEWEVRQEIFEKVCKIFGHPKIDLFASRLNFKVDKYVSRFPDPSACAIDAFSVSWNKTFFYAFPPFSCVAKSVQKILREKARGILLVPWWPTQPWWGRLMELGLRRLKFRGKTGNLRPVGKPTNEAFVNRLPLGAFLFWGRN